jgi:hypothetical protein
VGRVLLRPDARSAVVVAMSALTAFLRARLDEDERLAKRAARFRWDHPKDAPWKRAKLLAAQVPGNYIEEHIGRFADPSRVLAEVEAKRQVIDLCEGAIEAGEIKPNTTWNDDAKGAVVGEAVLRLLALPYASHSDYDPKWIPEVVAS